MGMEKQMFDKQICWASQRSWDKEWTLISIPCSVSPPFWFLFFAGISSDGSIQRIGSIQRTGPRFLRTKREVKRKTSGVFSFLKIISQN